MNIFGNEAHPKKTVVWKTFILILVGSCTLFLSSLYDNAALSITPSPARSTLAQIRYWAYQIQDLDSPGAIQAIVDSPYDMVVLEPTVTFDDTFDAKDMVQRIKASKASDGVSNKLVIAYIDIGQAEEWRWYWDGHTTYEAQGACQASFIAEIQQWAPWVVACDPDGWAGNYPVAYWTTAWKGIVLNGTSLGPDRYFDSILDEVLQDGFDGVYLDWVEAWEMSAVQLRAQQEGKDPAAEMVTLIQEIRQYGQARNSNFLVIQQNSSALLGSVGAAVLDVTVDAIAQEGIWWEGEASDEWNDPNGHDLPSVATADYLPRLRAYKAAGFPVFACEYAVSNAENAYQQAAAEGFIAYATRRSLSQLTTTPPAFVTDLGYLLWTK